MQNYVFLIILAFIFAFKKRSRTPALIMIISYVFYLLVTNNIASDKIYYIGVTLQEAVLCTLFSLHYFKTGLVNSKYMAYLSFAGVFVHIYGRIVYGYMSDTGTYVFLCIAVVSAQIILMLMRPINDGIHTGAFRSCRLRFNSSASNKPSAKMPVKVDKESVK